MGRAHTEATPPILPYAEERLPRRGSPPRSSPSWAKRSVLRGPTRTLVPSTRLTVVSSPPPGTGSRWRPKGEACCRYRSTHFPSMKPRAAIPAAADAASACRFQAPPTLGPRSPLPLRPRLLPAPGTTARPRRNSRSARAIMASASGGGAVGCIPATADMASHNSSREWKRRSLSGEDCRQDARIRSSSGVDRPCRKRIANCSGSLVTCAPRVGESRPRATRPDGSCYLDNTGRGENYYRGGNEGHEAHPGASPDAQESVRKPSSLTRSSRSAALIWLATVWGEIPMASAISA